MGLFDIAMSVIGYILTDGGEAKFAGEIMSNLTLTEKTLVAILNEDELTEYFKTNNYRGNLQLHETKIVVSSTGEKVYGEYIKGKAEKEKQQAYQDDAAKRDTERVRYQIRSFWLSVIAIIISIIALVRTFLVC